MKVIFDTNIWRYLDDAGATDEIRLSSRRRKLTVLIPPATAFEISSTNDPNLRVQLLKNISMHEWKRLMPEAFTESQQIIAEIERHRPAWMLPKPDNHRYRPLFRDWKSKNGFWRRLSEQPEKFSDVLHSSSQQNLYDAQNQSYAQRDNLITNGITKTSHLDKWTAALRSPRDGWNGDRVEPWRVDAMAALTLALKDKSNPYTEWISCYVDLNKIDFRSGDWVKFWLHDCQREQLPRQWLRWAVSFLQAFRKTTDGNPADIQLAQYVPECDVFVTADKNLGWVLNECKQYAICAIPEVWIIPGGREGVTKILGRFTDSTA